jgi:hypothetical protein
MNENEKSKNRSAEGCRWQHLRPARGQDIFSTLFGPMIDVRELLEQVSPARARGWRVRRLVRRGPVEKEFSEPRNNC